MTQAFHFLEIGTLDLVCSSLAHFWRSAPVVLSGQKVDGAPGHIDLMDPITGIESTEVEVEIPVKDSLQM